MLWNNINVILMYMCKHMHGSFCWLRHKQLVASMSPIHNQLAQFVSMSEQIAVVVLWILSVTNVLHQIQNPWLNPKYNVIIINFSIYTSKYKNIETCIDRW